MKYVSTRDGSLVVSFEEALTSGYAGDGGLWVPRDLPGIDLEELWKLDYVGLAFVLVRKFVSIDEIPTEDLKEICKQAFEGFEEPFHAVPVVQVGPLYIAELFHGPTFCFKDLGMRAVVGLLSYFASKKQQAVTLLVSTTGDTGPAAVQAVADIANPLLTLLVHYPHDQISDFQRKQLTTVASDCVKVAAFEGGGDDMDQPIKNMLTTHQQETSDTIQMTGVNSYNIGRPLMQTVHYFWTYFRVCDAMKKTPSTDFEIDIILPTGAMGNMTGGYMAKQMGLPIRKLCAGVNANDVTHRVVSTGTLAKSPKMLKTLSEAINVQLPYNFERLLFYLTNGDHDLVKSWMTTIDTTKKLELDVSWHAKLQHAFSSARVDDDAMCSTLLRVQKEHNYLSDPHTAVALAAAYQLGYFKDDNNNNNNNKYNSNNSSSTATTAALLATASPCKFEHSVATAIGKEGWEEYIASPDFPARAKVLFDKVEVEPTRYRHIPNKTPEEVQAVWEDQARRLVQQLNKTAA